MTNNVQKQNYYYRNGIEVKDIIRDVLDFFGSDLTGYEASCVYNVLKYLMRYKFKGNPEQDLNKAIIELEWLKDEIKNE